LAYLEIASDARSETVINKSRFLGFLRYAETEEAALKALLDIRSAYPDATHHCYAYMIGPERGIMRYSDDGEPQGTAGVPILEVIRQAGLTNILAVVVRYFGGVLLGAGGLVRAYTSCTAEALKSAVRVRPAVMDAYALDVSYAVWAKLEPHLRQQGLGIEDVRYEDTVKSVALCPKGSDAVSRAAAEYSSGTAGCSLAGEKTVRLPADQ
jgi:uncharacterized YigZ family protein